MVNLVPWGFGGLDSWDPLIRRLHPGKLFTAFAPKDMEVWFRRCSFSMKGDFYVSAVNSPGLEVYQYLPSLKLTASSHLKMDGSKM